ncbi:MAG: carbohydrate ABC transporter permease [Bacillota bacterium]
MKSKTGFYLTIPALTLLVLILIGPLIYTFILSITSIDLNFVGLSNYFRLFQDSEFWNSFKVTLIFTGFTVPIELLVGFGLALITNRALKARGLIRLAIIFPWALPTALNAIAWRWMYNADFGLFNNMLIEFGVISQSINWLGQIPLAMISMMIVSIWKTSSFMALLILTGLQTIPNQLYEAAKIDGASSWDSLMKITIPLLKPAILIALLFRTRDAFRSFGLPFNLTGGGPVNSTKTLAVYTYETFFQYLDFNYAATIALIQFVVLFILAIIYLRNAKVSE